MEAAQPSEEEEEEQGQTSDIEPLDGSENEEEKIEKAKPKKKNGKAKGKGGVLVPEEWPWEEAKKLFQKPDVTPSDEIEVRNPRLRIARAHFFQVEWNNPDVEGLVQFLVNEKGFQ